MFVLLGLPFFVFGQKHDYVWMFGYNSTAENMLDIALPTGFFYLILTAKVGN